MGITRDQLEIKRHAAARMLQRRITTDHVLTVLNTGEVIENYPTDQPFPSRLVLAVVGSRPLHVVAADDSSTGQTIVITVYEPDPGEWDEEFRHRRTP